MSFVTYDYECPACGHTEERTVDRKDADFQVCERHKAMTLMKRRLAAPKTTFRHADRRLKR